MAPKLYQMDLSPSVRSVYLAAKHMGIELEHVETSLIKKDHLKPEYVKLNPQHTIPTLEDDGKVIWDSHAINVYLVTKYGKEDPLYPKDAYKRAVIDQRLHFDSGVLFALIRAIVRPVLYKGATTVPDDLVEEVNVAYEFVEVFLGENKWVTGDNITLADFSILTSVTSLDVLVPLNATKYPNTIAWIKRAQQLPYYEANQKGLNDFRATIQFIMS